MAEQKSLILLIDDDKEFKEILSIKLQSAGFNTAEAGNGEEGIRKIKQIKPDLILLDLKMPVMNGAETLLGIKSDPDLQNFKVIFLTNYGEPKKELSRVDEKFAQEVGALGYINKNSDLNSIVEEVKNILRASTTNNSGDR